MIGHLAQFDGRVLVIGGAVFTLILSVWLVVVLLFWRRRRDHDDTMRQRLAVLSEEDDTPRVLRLWRDGKETTMVVAGRSLWRTWWRKVEALPEAAGWELPVRAILLGLGGVMCLAFALAFAAAGSVAVGLAAAALAPIVFWIYTAHRINSQRNRFERQFVDALDLVARSLKAGHPLIGAFRLAAEEMHAPVSTLFAEICQEQSMGMDLQQSLQKAASGGRGSDVKLFGTSIVIQMRSGGNLAEMIERLAEVIRDRIRLNRRVRIVTSQVQLSKRILLALPVFMFVLLNLLNPAHMEGLYTTDMGHMMLAAGGAAMLMGWWVMNQMVKVKY